MAEIWVEHFRNSSPEQFAMPNPMVSIPDNVMQNMYNILYNLVTYVILMGMT
jgi:hypothetical protein